MTRPEFIAYCPTREPKWVMDASGNWVLKQFIRFKDAAGRLAEMEVTQTQIGEME